MNHSPPEATPHEAYAADANRQIKAAQESGGYTAVLTLAEQRWRELQEEFATLTAGHEIRRTSIHEREELRRHWTPEKARLNEQIVELDLKIREWRYIADQCREHAANEALGWTILPDGTSAKVLPNGKVLSSHSYLSSWEDSDGRTYTSDGPDEQWRRRHQRYGRALGDRVRAERLEQARRRPSASPQRHARQRRPNGRRPATHASRSSSRSGDSGGDDGPAEPEPPGRRDLRHVSHALDAFLEQLGGAR
jgi:hypothetical protein